MVEAVLVLVGVFLAAALVHALFCHDVIFEWKCGRGTEVAFAEAR